MPPDAAAPAGTDRPAPDRPEFPWAAGCTRRTAYPCRLPRSGGDRSPPGRQNISGLSAFQPTSVGQNRADRFAFAEQFETFVDLREWQHMGDQIIDVDLAVHVPV